VNIVGEMKYFLGDGDDYAQLKFSESKSAFSIDIVLVPAAHRNQGVGTALINHVLLLADCMGKEVNLCARPIGSASEEVLARLVAYYQGLGFEVIDTGVTTAYMTRKGTGKKAKSPQSPD
jgi:GNAT superfamily N-acetyltransferase